MKMITSGKRLLTMALALAMVFSLIPPVSAANETRWGPVEYFYEPSNDSTTGLYLLSAVRVDLDDPNHKEKAVTAYDYETDPAKTVTVWPTCTVPGQAVLEGGAKFPVDYSWAATSETIHATVPCEPHDYGYSEKESTPATYRTDGVRVLICSRCGARVEEVSPRLIPPLPAALSMSYFPTCVDNPDHYMYKSYYALKYLSAEEIQLQEDDYYHVKVHFDSDLLLKKFNDAYGPHALVEDTFPAVPYVYDYNDNTWTQDDEPTVSFTCKSVTPPAPVEIPQLIVNMPEPPVVNTAIADFLQDDPDTPYTVTGTWWKLGADGSGAMRLEAGKPVAAGQYELRLVAVPREGYVFKSEVYYDPIRDCLTPDENGNILLTEKYTVKPLEVTVNFFLNGGIAGPSSVTVKDGAVLDLSSLPLAVHPPVNGIPVIHLGWDTGIFAMLDHSMRNPRILYTNSDSITVTNDMTLSAVYGLDENRNGIADCMEKLTATDIRFTFDKSVMTPVISPDGVREYMVELPSNTGTDRVNHKFYGEFLDQFGEMRPEFPRPVCQNTTESDYLIYDPTGYIMVLPGAGNGESLTISFPNNGQKEKYGPDLPTYRVTFRITDEVVPYTVVHKLENWEQNPGTYVEKVQQTAYGIAGTQTAAAQQVFANFTPKAIEQKEIAADGSTVITVFYDRDRYNLTWDFGPASPVDDNYPNGLTPVGKVCIPPKLTEVEGLKFSRFFPKIPFAMPAKDATISAIWQVEEKPQEFVYHVNGKAPTHTEDGWKGYYVSGGTQRYYEDCYANVEIPNLQQWLQGPGKLPKLPYVILEGDNSQWTSGSAEGLRFRSDGEFDTFRGIRVDGADVAAEHYTAAEGSTVVTLKAAYLGTLEHREHTLTFLFDGGSVDARFKVKSADVDPDGPTDPVDPAPTTAKYTVRHMREKLGTAGNYEQFHADNLTGTIGGNTRAAARTEVGFTAQSFRQAEIKADGSTVVEIRYTRNIHKLTFDPNGGQFEGSESVDLPFGTPITAPKVVRDGFTFDGWKPAAPETMPDQDVTCVAQWTTTSHTHKLTRVEGCEPTPGSDGWKDYYECSCGKFFEDEDGTREIGNLREWKQGAGKIPALGYKFLEGMNATWKKNSGKDLTFRANGDLDCFVSIEVDGKTLDRKDYTVASGSTVVKLKDGYLQGLKVGTHKLKANFVDGECETQFKITSAPTTPGKDPTSPKTGDESRILTWSLISMGSLAAVLLLSLPRKKRE